MNVYPMSFCWIDQNEDIAASMGWRWLAALEKKCVEKRIDTSFDRVMDYLAPDRFAYYDGYGIWEAEMHWLEPYTYPTSMDKAPIQRSYGKILPPPPPITLYCAIVHARIGYPAAFIDELDAWSVAYIKAGEELNQAVYPHHPEGEWWPSTFATWKYSAYRAIRDWQYRHSQWLPIEAFQRKILP